MPAKDDPDELIGRTIGGRYRIISRLGAGGMGVAYRAWDEQAGVPVVVKMPRRSLLEDPAFAERFSREIRLLRGLAHPHVVPISDVGAHAGLPFVVMRFLPGGSLIDRRLRDERGTVRPNPPGMLHLWLPAIAEALDFVHSRGVVHRDVKPANIFFDAFWGAYLGDFGIAKIVEESEAFDKEHTLTATHVAHGTQAYMSPERFTPKSVIDGRADQYALAVTTYELLAGPRPFTGESNHIIAEVLTQPVPSLQERCPDLPASLVDAVHRGLAKRPEERFATCAAFAAAALRGVQPIAEESGVARLLCPNCPNMLKLPTEAAGKTGKCPKCRTRMQVANDLGALWLVDEARGRDTAAATPTRKPARRKARTGPPAAVGSLLAALFKFRKTARRGKSPLLGKFGSSPRLAAGRLIGAVLGAALLVYGIDRVVSLFPEPKRPPTIAQRLERARSEQEPASRSRELVKVARLQFKWQDRSGALKTLDEAWHIMPDDGDPSVCGPRLVEVAGLHAEMGEKRLAREVLRRALEATNKVEHPATKAQVLAAVAAVQGSKTAGLGDSASARRTIDSARRAADATEDRDRAQALAAVASGCLAAGFVEEARDMIPLLVEFTRMLEDSQALAEGLVVAANICIGSGDTDTAATLLDDAKKATGRMGDPVARTKALKEIRAAQATIDGTLDAKP